MLKCSSELDRLFYALSDQTRLAIVDRLAQGEATVSDLAAPFDMSLPAVHQHLSVLQAAGVVSSTKRGRTRVCRLDMGALTRIEDWVAGRRRMWERRLDGLERYLKEEQDHDEHST